MLDFYDVIRTRRSVRAFKKDPVPEEALNRVLEAAELHLLDLTGNLGSLS